MAQLVLETDSLRPEELAKNAVLTVMLCARSNPRATRQELTADWIQLKIDAFQRDSKIFSPRQIADAIDWLLAQGILAPAARAGFFKLATPCRVHLILGEDAS